MDNKDYNIELINIFSKIESEYYVLMSLSETNKEQTEEYQYHINRIYNLYIFLIDKYSNLSYEELVDILRNIQQPSSKCPNEYIQVSIINFITFITDKVYQNTNQEESEEEFEEEYEEELDEYIEETEEELTLEEKYLQEYDDKLDDSYDEALSIIYLTATKKLFNKLSNIKTNNNQEKKYQLRLFKYLKNYKRYEFLKSNIILELMSLKVRFNPYLLYMSTSEDYSPIYYNISLGIIKDLYESPKSNKDPDEILTNLFDITCFEEIIKYLNKEQLSNLKSYCLELNKIHKESNYGEYCLSRIK